VNSLPDDNGGSSHVSLRVPNDLMQEFDRLAATLDRPRSWVILRALRQYPEDEGAEITGDVESLAELDRGEIVSAEDLRHRTEEVITAAEKARLQIK
jgi:predicted transcriptional regulator